MLGIFLIKRLEYVKSSLLFYLYRYLRFGTHGGVVGICQLRPFITYPEQGFPLFMEKLNGPRRMEVTWDILKKRGLSENEVEKIMGKNVYRICQEVIG